MKVKFICARCGKSASSQKQIDEHATSKRENGTLATMKVIRDEESDYAADC